MRTAKQLEFALRRLAALKGVSFESVVATNGDYGVFLTLEDTINSMTIDDIRAVAALFLDQASAPKTLVLGPLEE